jgi:4-amino-4-deoxy-L-arabinose transferase-like glycosyltransferase
MSHACDARISSPEYGRQVNLTSLKLAFHTYVLDISVLVIASYFVLFLHLGKGAIRQWDESSLAVNALEMSLSGHLMVKTMDGEPDFVNTKPPLLIWFIVGFMRLLGYNETALRLPSALSALATILIVYFYTLSVSRQRIAGLAAGLVLLTSIGFTGEHVARTGDYDAMLTLWVTLYALSCFKYLEEIDGQPKQSHLALAVCGLILAVMTKGVAGALILPGLLVYALWRRRLIRLLSIPSVYGAGVISIVAIGGYYGIRELLGPGYLEAIVRNELTGRFLALVPEGTERSRLYNLNALLSYRFTPWIYLLPVCWWITAQNGDQAVRRFGMFSLSYVYCYLAVISVSETKFRWYDAPMYPIAAAIIGMAIGAALVSAWTYVATIGRGHFGIVDCRARVLLKWVLASAAVVGIFGYPYFNNAYLEVYRGGVPFRENDGAVTDTAQRFKTYYGKLAAANLPLGTKPLKVVNSHRYNQPLVFYSRVAELERRYVLEVQWRQPWAGPFNVDDILVNCDPALGVAIRQRHSVKMLHRWASCETLLVEG